MELKLYNTLTRKKEPFRPLDRTNVRMYVCGPTVYDFAHIGNARPVIVFDVLYRLLRHLYGAEHVKYVRNITDVDDKINARAAEEYPGLPLNDAIRQVTEKTERQFHEDVAALGCLEPTHQPRATDYVRRNDGVLDMVTLIQRLIDNGNAYEKERHVLFRVDSMPDYGKLAGRSLDEMIAGARVEVAPFKENPMDFVLWKPSSENEPGWDSPWGRGRPGWHIECSAMSAALLGKEFDIHGGGIDLVFPHHENELAQSRCAFHSDRMAQVWMHNGFLQVEGAKMSKSLGNFVTIRELLTEWPGEAIRFNMLRTHYRQPINWTSATLEEAFRAYFDILEEAEEYLPSAPAAGVLQALADDLNTPQAIAELQALRVAASKGDIDAGASLRASLQLLGLATKTRESGIVMPQTSQGAGQDQVLEAFMALFPKNYPIGRALQVLRNSNLDDLENDIEIISDLLKFVDPAVRVGDVARLVSRIPEVNQMRNLRLAARKAKDFKESDRIRDELKAMGVVLKDNKDGTTTWEVAR